MGDIERQESEYCLLKWLSAFRSKMIKLIKVELIC